MAGKAQCHGRVVPRDEIATIRHLVAIEQRALKRHAFRIAYTSRQHRGKDSHSAGRFRTLQNWIRAIAEDWFLPEMYVGNGLASREQVLRPLIDKVPPKLAEHQNI
jgi:hypothetical protein